MRVGWEQIETAFRAMMPSGAVDIEVRSDGEGWEVEFLGEVDEQGMRRAAWSGASPNHRSLAEAFWFATVAWHTQEEMLNE